MPAAAHNSSCNDIQPFVDAIKVFFSTLPAADSEELSSNYQQIVPHFLFRVFRWLLESMTTLTPELQQLETQLPSAFVESTSATIGFAGIYSGSLSIHCPSSLANLLASHMIGSDCLVEYESSFDAMGELANVMAGEVKQALSAGGLDIQLSTPSIVSGAHYLLSKGENRNQATVHCSVLGEPFYISLVAERNRLLQVAAEELRSKREWLTLAIEGGGLGLWSWEVATGAAGYSDEWAAILGYSVEELLPEITTWQSLIFPEDLPKVHEVMNSCLSDTTGICEIEHRLLTRTGEWRWVLMRGKVVERSAAGKPKRVSGTLLDIDQRKLAEQALLASQQAIVDSEQRLRCITDSAQDAILMMDPSCNISYWNPAAETMLGYTAAEALGRNLHITLAPERYLEQHLAAVKSFFRNGLGDAVGRTLELSARRKNGTEIPISLSLSSVKIDDRWHAVGIMRDISEAKRYEAQLKQINEELTARVAEEVGKNRDKDRQLMQQEKLASIGQLAAGVAHEINNPMGFVMSNLNSLNKYVESLQEYYSLVERSAAGSLAVPDRDALAAVRKKYKIDYISNDLKPLIEESIEGAERVRRIVLDLKDFARPDSSDMQPAELNHLVRSTINIVHNELKYVAELDLQLGELPPLLCHPQQINQVITNILVNAAHAIEHQGVITIRTYSTGPDMFLEITDTGCGIPKEYLSRIFEPFFTTKDVGKGTGLGLSICYDIIKNHNGEIQVTSEVGTGTRFTVRLPVNEAAGAA